MGYPDLPLHSNPAKIPAASVPPVATSAPAWTSRDQVTPAMNDAFFFRALEEEGILLNTEQIEAVRHQEGPLLIVAGAGSGKTTVLAARTAYLIAVLGIPASRILLVTFTSKAAQEIKERIARIPGIPAGAARSVEARTFHSFGLMLLRKSGFTQRILGDFAPRHTIMKIILRKLDPSGVYQPETVLAALSSWKMQGYWPSQLPEDTKDEAAMKRIMMAYEQWNLERNQWDFDDILLHTLKLLEDPKLLAQLQSRFAYIMVDEFQDTNAVQYSLVQHLSASSTRNIAVVGDDDQTIYSFNGARQESILEFDQVYPNSKRVTLHINYRSDYRILGLGSAVVRHNKLRLPKELVASAPSGAAPVYLSPASVDEEAQWVVGHLMDDVKAERINYGDIAILHRTAGSSRAMLEQLLLHGVPFVQYGSAPVFYDQALIRPLMDHLRLSLIPRRMESLQSVLGPLYVPKEQGMAFITEQEQRQAKKYPLIHLTRWDRLQPFQQEAVKERVRLIKSLKLMKPIYAVQEMRRLFYDKYMEAGDPLVYTQYKETVNDGLAELESAAARFDTVEQFITYADELTARQQQMEALRDREHGTPAVQLMTIHRAKGLEFRRVYLIGASEGILPHSTALKDQPMAELKADHPKTPNHMLAEAALEEERRLAYVAVTRAKEQLYISSPMYYHGKPTEPSRFLLEAFGISRTQR